MLTTAEEERAITMHKDGGSSGIEGQIRLGGGLLGRCGLGEGAALCQVDMRRAPKQEQPHV